MKMEKQIDENVPLKILGPCVLFIVAIDFIYLLFFLYTLCLPQWPVFHDFSDVFLYLESARQSIHIHLEKQDVLKKD